MTTSSHRVPQVHAVLQAVPWRSYNLLLEKVPFRRESDLLSKENTSKTYLQECQLRGLVTNEEQLLVGASRNGADVL